MAFQLDGKNLPIGVAFTTSDGTQYPANWLNLSSDDEKKALGITEVADPKTYDNRFYYTDGTAKELNDKDTIDGETGQLVKNADGSQHITYGIKTKLKNIEKEIASTLLSKYDWYVTRKQEKGTEIPTAITTYRDAIRTACNTRETEITNCSDVDSLKTLLDGVYKDGKKISGLTDFPSDPYNPV